MEEQNYINAGQKLFGWQVDEFVAHERSGRWYAVAAIVATGLLIYAIATANYFFAVIILMAGILMLLNHFQGPEKLDVYLTTAGVVLGESLYEYKQIQSFAVVYQPPEIKNMYLFFGSIMQPPLSIPLEAADPNEVREILLNFLPENLEQDGERLTDTVRRVYKL